LSSEPISVAELYAKGSEALSKYTNVPSPYVYGLDHEAAFDSSVRANRRYLDSLFFVPKFLDPVDADTGVRLFGVDLRTPIFCTAIAGLSRLSKDAFFEIGTGLRNAGSLMMVGIGGADDLQKSIDTGVPVVKIVKPYRNTDLIYEKVRDARSRGCVAVGMDIDHFHGRLKGDRVYDTELMGPVPTEEIGQLIGEAGVPFVIKGVLSQREAERALEIGASALIVSNHGSGALEFSVPSMIALPDVVAVAGDRVPVLVDTGFRTGSDVLKGLAFGACGVGLAVPIMLAWAAEGSGGVYTLITQLTAELRRTMAATGCPDARSVSREIIREMPPPRQ
jgi:isopentenyl diphosphate isomerase/L-lactate dehydrogenase-like FMN-dependent dehydrogenase